MTNTNTLSFKQDFYKLVKRYMIFIAPSIVIFGSWGYTIGSKYNLENVPTDKSSIFIPTDPMPQLGVKDSPTIDEIPVQLVVPANSDPNTVAKANAALVSALELYNKNTPSHEMRARADASFVNPLFGTLGGLLGGTASWALTNLGFTYIDRRNRARNQRS